MATTLAAQAVGSTVALTVDGESRNFLVVHQGNPDPSVYDASCDGAWLLMQDVYTERTWDSRNLYPEAAVHSWLNDSFLALLDSGVQAAVKSVKLPYAADGGVLDGADGAGAKVFLLSMRELGVAASQKSGLADEGACLDYFAGSALDDPIRSANLNGAATRYWTRSAYTPNSTDVWTVAGGTGKCTARPGTSTYGVRPALILPQTLAVEDGVLQPNAAPSIVSASGASGVDLGVRNLPFTFEYTVTDPEGAGLSLTETLDQEPTRSLTAASGSTQRFEAVYDSLRFVKLANGSHSMQVTASDGLAEASFTASFTKAATAATLTLSQPMAAASPITAASLTVGGDIPADAALTVKVTNNALDDEPVWQDATAAVRAGSNILFANTAAANGPAFNFSIEVSRGASGTGGYIDSVSGAFQ